MLLGFLQVPLYPPGETARVVFARDEFSVRENGTFALFRNQFKFIS